MKHYIIYVVTLDGDYEYLDKSILSFDGDSTDIQAVLEKYFGEPLTNEYGKWWSLEDDYRCYTVRSLREISVEHFEILKNYL
jgi:hypothetical protein